VRASEESEDGREVWEEEGGEVSAETGAGSDKFEGGAAQSGSFRCELRVERSAWGNCARCKRVLTERQSPLTILGSRMS
jgi:hypothetical protein